MKTQSWIVRLALLATLAPGCLHAYESLQGPTEVIYLDAARAYPGYTGFGARGKTYLLDLEGRVVHTVLRASTRDQRSHAPAGRARRTKPSLGCEHRGQPPISGAGDAHLRRLRHNGCQHLYDPPSTRPRTPVTGSPLRVPPDSTATMMQLV